MSPSAPALADPHTEKPVRKPMTYHVATALACDRETAELGEDYPELKKIERAYRLLERRLERAPVKLHAGRAIKTAHDLAMGLADIRHDASLGSTLALAKDAYEEARVVKIARTFARRG